MKRDNVAIVGSGGYIAGYLKGLLRTNSEIGNIISIDKINDGITRYIDLADASSINNLLLDDIDYIIFLAAISSPDACAIEYGRCWDINVTGTSALIRRAMDKKIKVLFFSSDAVFGEDGRIPFDEDSITNANTPYGCMKRAVENEFSSDHNFKAVRLSYVASATDKFVRYCLECIRNNVKAEIFHPFYRNCTTVSVVTRVVGWLISNWERYQPSFLNVAGVELVSRIRIADEINRCMNKELKYSITCPDTEFFIRRPAITQMKSKYLYELGILEPLSFTELFAEEMRGIRL